MALLASATAVPVPAVAPSPVVPSLAVFGAARVLAGLGGAVGPGGMDGVYGPGGVDGMDGSYGVGGVERLGRVAHLARHGSPPDLSASELVALAEDTGLRGRGGAGFPFARKVRAVMEGRRRTGGRVAVVVNGSEGEPGCLKDTALLLFAPHLVLDGALLAARALGAEEVAVGVTRADVARSVRRAIAERGPLSTPVRAQLLAERFVTGEGTALTDGLDRGPGLPSGRKVRSSERGLHGLPTLLSNTETYAQLAVAARMGALDYRATGDPAAPGTVLLTVAGERVVEAPTGVPLARVLALCGLGPGQGVLIGGYHGTWLPPSAAGTALLSRADLAAYGAVLGAGAVLPLPEGTCPAGETVRVARWMAAESAGQCGPCVLGLPALADALGQAVGGDGQRALDAVQDRMRAVERRGACSHPDGTARFIASALAAFPDEFARHAGGAGCGRPVLGALPVPGETAYGVGGAPETSGARRSGDRAATATTARPHAPEQRLLVDWTLCQGHGLCADLVPGMVRLGPDGYPERAAMPLPARMRRRAQLAVRRCPALALRVQHGE
ncbi:oxidoreductase [Streptomyces chrestomyceticus JCM 4735]|uniref:Oxidoreductase n=1 Tax=Streptomyces chrestomyceticus JCM 4735 TaxID=1306181 RepID=A0A7U9PYH0_9ACTN|nr:NADH-quinone oxidoreductase subunit NuoF family protein [Streptomyces chrestomyceticus]GCD37417.1 oxidoreductase [Streptomyces chrestomyceticus JCM 4735]